MVLASQRASEVENMFRRVHEMSYLDLPHNCAHLWSRECNFEFYKKTCWPSDSAYFLFLKMFVQLCLEKNISENGIMNELPYQG
jgi:hypothetical protein